MEKRSELCVWWVEGRLLAVCYEITLKDTLSALRKKVVKTELAGVDRIEVERMNERHE